MRVVSMVPSWTETLCEAGVEVVGRTRFCVHPAARVAGIPAVGGTKDWDLAKVRRAAPDLIVLDREENPAWMAEQAPCAWAATHVRGADGVGAELAALARATGCAELKSFAARWNKAAAAPPRPRFHSWDTLPGLIKWLRRPAASPAELERVEYLIWRNPWMGVAPQTFIGSMLARAGFSGLLVERSEPYPQLTTEAFAAPERTLLLCSTEPYPFARFHAEVAALGCPAALVDGEAYSWFGVRSLRFLESLG